LLSLFFRKNARGATGFFPLACAGPGYLIPVHRQEDARQAVRLNVLALVIAVSAFILLVSIGIRAPQPSTRTGLSALIIMLATIIGLTAIAQLRIACGLRPIEVPGSLSVRMRRSRQMRTARAAWTRIVAACGFSAITGAALAHSCRSGYVVATIGAVVLLFIGVGLIWDGALSLREKSRVLHRT
jgi:hypothetical protein